MTEVEKGAQISVRLLKLSAAYLSIGSLLGMYMGVKKDFALSSVHAHVALLGWLALAIAGLVYKALPACGAGLLAKIHFWGHNIGLLPMMVSLSVYAYGVESAEPVVAASSSLVLVSLLIFAANVGLNAGRPGTSRGTDIRERESYSELV